jgi:hypothetical protein
VTRFPTGNRNLRWRESKQRWIRSPIAGGEDRHCVRRAARGERQAFSSPPNLPSWGRVPIMARFCARRGCVVSLMNDANANAVAEWSLMPTSAALGRDEFPIVLGVRV